MNELFHLSQLTSDIDAAIRLKKVRLRTIRIMRPLSTDPLHYRHEADRILSDITRYRHWKQLIAHAQHWHADSMGSADRYRAMTDSWVGRIR